MNVVTVDTVFSFREQLEFLLTILCKAGQSIGYINGQLILSIADIQWVLHNLSNTGTTINVRISGSSRNYVLAARAGWKRTDVSWRGSMWNVRPRLRVWMPEATTQELKKLNLPAGQKALKVKWINTNSPEGRKARDAGLRTGDFVIAVDGKPMGNMTPREFNTHVKLNYKPGQNLPITLWRNGKRIEFNWPLK